MRISDWSSDVCSSDLLPVILPAIAARVKMDHLEAERMGPVGAAGAYAPAVAETHSGVVFFAGERAYKLKKDVRSEERRVGKEGSVRVDLGGRRNMNKKQTIPKEKRRMHSTDTT